MQFFIFCQHMFLFFDDSETYRVQYLWDELFKLLVLDLLDVWWVVVSANMFSRSSDPAVKIGCRTYILALSHFKTQKYMHSQPF